MKVLLPAFRQVMLAVGSAVAVSGLVSSCTGDSFGDPAGDGGYIRLYADLNSHVDESVASRAAADASNLITADDLILTLSSVDGKISRVYSSINEFDTDERFAAGEYTFEAAYGAADAEGFDAPYYYGRCDFNVSNGRVTEVNLEASLANSMVSVVPTDAFRKYFGDDFSSTLHSEGGAYIEIGADENRAAYLRSGNVTMTTSVTLPAGSDVTLEVGSFEAAPRTHYVVTLDLADRFGDAEIVITFDERTELEPVSIVLSPELVNAPAPSVTLQCNPAIEVVMGCGPYEGGDVRFDLVAPGKLRSLVMTTTGAPELEAAGWPAEVDLIKATEEQRAAMTALGLRAPGVTMESPSFASVVLADVLHLLRGTKASFALRATDCLGKSSEPVSLTVDIEERYAELHGSGIREIGMMDESMFVTPEYNGDFDFRFYIAETGSDEWTETRLIGLVDNGMDCTGYDAEIAVPLDWQSFRVKMANDVCESNVLDVRRKMARIDLSAPSGAAWATMAYLTVTSDGLSADQLANVKLQVAVGAGDYSEVAASCQSDGTFLLAGLLPSTEYSVKASFGPAESQAVSFVTEAAADVPNGDFEQLKEPFSLNLQQGGKWTITATSSSTRYSTTLDLSVCEPEGWATTNAKTCYSGASNHNSWYMIPSVYNTTLSWTTHQPSAKVWGIGQSAYNETPDIYKGLAAASGSNAMVIRNVAWDSAGASIADDVKTGNTSYSNYYCSKVPAIANRSAGKLFLGEYSFDGSVESINQGVAFASRPLALSGQYKYVPDANDPDEAAAVTVEVLSGDDVIGHGYGELSASADYAVFTVAVDYTITDRRATSVRIMLSSSNHEDEAAIATTNYSNKLECCSRGAALTVDNLKFNY